MVSIDTSSAVSLLEAQVRAGFPDSIYLAPVVNEPLHPCANRGGAAVTITACASLGCSATKEQFERCLACPQGQRLAATSPFKPRPRSMPLPRPGLPSEDPGLVSLASTLRQLTADGRVRVSVLDVQRGLGAPTYDDTMRLVRRAGLTTGRFFGAVPGIAVDHSMRRFLERAEASA